MLKCYLRLIVLTKSDLFPMKKRMLISAFFLYIYYSKITGEVLENVNCLLTHDARRMTQDDGQKAIRIGHLRLRLR